MAERIAPETACPDALGGVTKILTAQAFALDRIFFRAAAEALTLGRGAHYHARKALKAQARCRATFKILLALRAAARQPEKFSDSTEGTIQALKTPCVANGLSEDATPAAPPAPQPASKRRGTRNRWSPERRARQAAAIREWQPWRNASGPRTPEGKSRSARNALKHGHKSRAYVEMLREDRRILRLAAGTIAIAKVSLRALQAPSFSAGLPAMARKSQARVSGVVSAEAQQAKAEAPRAKPGHRIGIGRARPTLIPFARKFSGNRGLSGLPPADNGAPPRRWRLARHDEEDVPLKQG